MKRLCWFLLLLYLALLAAFLGLYVADGAAEHWMPITVGLVLLTQALFLVVRGNPLILEPVRPRQLWLPAIIAGLMAAVLFGGFITAVAELLELDGNDWLAAAVYSITLLSWALWALLFYACCTHLDYFRSLRRIVLWLIAGSILQLLATVPSHVIVTRRPGCLVGIGTMVGIMGGLLVMCWAFGPGIILLFMYETRRRLKGHCVHCGYDLTGNVSGRCPECGADITAPSRKAES